MPTFTGQLGTVGSQPGYIELGTVGAPPAPTTPDSLRVPIQLIQAP